MTPLDKFKPIESKPSASERVAERLTTLISSGNIAPGDKLPSENELSRALHVSRPVVREALRGLAMMGIVESRQGGGCYVTDLKPNRLMAPLSFALSLQDYSLESLFRAREVIDCGIAADAARNATGEQIAMLEELADQGRKLVDDPVAFRVMDAEFHEVVGKAAGNDFLDNVARSLYGLAIDQRRKASALPGVLEQSARDHEQIIRAISRRDPEGARLAMNDHVRHIRDTTLKAMEGGETIPFRPREGG
ncbi:MAG: FadR/GntR family transcriptional regulator [Devosia sp.]|nr:FadR/GntR family transcriptional regulator [Devosia sp.]